MIEKIITGNFNVSKDSYSYENTPSIMNKNIFYYLESCGHFKSLKGYLTSRKDFDSFLMLYSLSGTGYLTYRNKNYTLKGNSIFIIDCKYPQLYLTDNEDLWEFKYLHFNGAESRAYVNRIMESKGTVTNISKRSIILKNIDQMIDLAKKKDERIDIVCSCLIVEILTEILLYSTENQTDSFIPSYVKSAIAIIETEYGKKINLEQIASEISLSKFYLTKIFKKYTGHNLYEYLIDFRLNKSKELLKNTETPIGIISEEVGFESISHFIKIFKQKESITPLQFRKFWR
ncbi:MAG TPA: AraC family transcriptional regulator [Clostridiaceae bacterium]